MTQISKQRCTATVDDPFGQLPDPVGFVAPKVKCAPVAELYVPHSPSFRFGLELIRDARRGKK